MKSQGRLLRPGDLDGYSNFDHHYCDIERVNIDRVAAPVIAWSRVFVRPRVVCAGGLNRLPATKKYSECVEDAVHGAQPRSSVRELRCVPIDG